MDERTSIEYRGVRVELAHVNAATRAPMLQEADHCICGGQRLPLLTVRAGGVDVSERPDLWPRLYRDYRGSGRLEWVGISE